MSAISPRVVREGKRFFKFTVVGLVGAVVDFGTFNLLSAILGIWSVVASMLSFTAAVTSNFVWNRFWTYPDSRTKPIRHQAGQFAIVNLIGLAIRTPIFALAEPRRRFVVKYAKHHDPVPPLAAPGRGAGRATRTGRWPPCRPGSSGS